MNNLMKFENKEFGQIRVIELNGEPWFIGKDVAEKLGYAEPRSTVSKKVDKEDRGVAKIETPSGIQEMTVINESGLYSLILSSQLGSAKKFKRWVTSEVLPQIRKTGAYMTELKGQEKMFQLLRNEVNGIINEIVSLKVKEIEEKCSDYYRPTHFDKTNISSYIKKRLGITKANDEYELVKQRVLLRLGATKWEDIPVEELRESLNIIDESIRVVKLDRPTQQVSFF